MRLYSTLDGIARGEADGTVALLDLDAADVGELVVRQALPHAAGARVRDVLQAGELELAPLVARPGKIIAVGLNFASHAAEAREKFAAIGRTDVQLPKEPNVQIVAGSAVVGSGGAVVLPEAAPGQVDYEGELAVVIGRTGSDIALAAAWSHVAGLTVINDISARDIQQRAYAGDPAASISVAKSFDTFKPLGPCMLTVDELDDAPDLRLRTWVNGELRQDDRTSSMIYSVPELIAWVSRHLTLEPGDVIACGSPRGAGQFTDRYLRAGDIVEVEIDGIGRLRTTIAGEPS